MSTPSALLPVDEFDIDPGSLSHASKTGAVSEESNLFPAESISVCG
ncbi:hypothetical protein JJ691_63210 [Kutzneria sp. CA-103260]|nr:hypothetical protein JJ691_63210 [Kutzneria sp. CA-103260]